MQELLTVIATWLSINFALPATDELPAVEFAEPAEITQRRYGDEPAETTPRRYGRAPTNAPDGETSTSAPTPWRNVVSVYDSATHTIILPERWTGDTPGETSVLVHEMVHHLQAVADLQYACPAEREAVAYKAQQKWLGYFQADLETEFDIDAFTLLATTHCVM